MKRFTTKQNRKHPKRKKRTRHRMSTIPHIYLFIGAGFGNIVLFITVLLYIHKRYNYYVTIVFKEKNCSSIFDLFPKELSHYVNCVCLKTDTLHSIHQNNTQQISRLPFSFSSMTRFLSTLRKPVSLFKLESGGDSASWLQNSMKCYYQLNKKTQGLLQLQKRVISKDIRDCGHYICVHIRYGDRMLNLSKTQRDHALIFTPEYYTDFIATMHKTHPTMPIYIITDSLKVVEHYIMPMISSIPTVRLMDIGFVDSFYLLSHSTYACLSRSSFSLVATMLAKTMRSAHIVARPKTSKGWVSEDEMIKTICQHTQIIKIMQEPKYILNYDIPRMLEIQEYNTNWKHDKHNDSV